MKLQAELRTDRLYLRQQTVADAEAIFRLWASDSETLRYVTWPAYESVDELRAFIAGAAERRVSGKRWGWLAECGREGIVGTLGMSEITPRVRGVGVIVARKFWGRGFATEGLRAVLDAAFAEEQVERVEAHCHVDNRASARVMEKAGMVLEGCHRRLTELPNLDGRERAQDMFVFARVRT